MLLEGHFYLGTNEAFMANLLLGVSRENFSIKVWERNKLPNPGVPNPGHTVCIPNYGPPFHRIYGGVLGTPMRKKRDFFFHQAL